MDQKDENLKHRESDVELYDIDVDLFLKLEQDSLQENTPNETNEFEEIALQPMEKPVLFEWVEALIIAVFSVVFIFIFIARPVGVDGESMLPTLNHGDNLIISNLFYTPEYGDVVVVTADNYYNGEKALVKRVIATEGQTIDINFDTGDVTIDGVLLDEPYIYEKTHLYEGTDFPQTVPEGHLFVMGDNRNNSTDSRAQDIGMIPIDGVLGRVVFRFLPISDIGIIN